MFLPLPSENGLSAKVAQAVKAAVEAEKTLYDSAYRTLGGTRKKDGSSRAWSQAKHQFGNKEHGQPQRWRILVVICAPFGPHWRRVKILRSGLAANAAMQACFDGKKHSFPNWLFNIAMKVMIQLSSFMDDKHYDLPLQNADFP